MALDARTRSSILHNLTPILGEHDANQLMSQFPSSEGDELVTKQFLRAELSEVRLEMAELRAEFKHDLHRQTVWLGGAVAASTAFLATLGALT